MASEPIRTVLVTGAAGYIASRYLGDRRGTYDAIALVRPGGGAGIAGPAREADLESVSLAGVDAVVHLAGVLPSSGATEAEYMRTNRDLAIALGKKAMAQGTRFLFISTGSVYGGIDGAPRTEEEVDASLTHPYIRSKREAEEGLRSLAQDGLALSILRFGSVFGSAPRMQYQSALNAFIARAKAGEPVEVWRTALQQVRPYTWVGDAAAAIDFALSNDLFKGDTYNIVSENASMQTVLNELEACFPGSEIRFVDHERMNELSFGMDDSRMRTIGFVPAGTLARGIAELAAL